MLVLTEQDTAQLLEFINANEMLAYDTETTGLNVRKDTVIGFGISSSTSGFYVPCYRWDTTLDKLLPYGPGPELVKVVLQALSRKQLLMFNASFDSRITKANFGISLLPALHTDVLLLKHTCDENFPLDLKGIGAKLYGQDAKKEQEELKSNIRANGGTAKQYFKADVQTLSKYCIQDCLLTYRIYSHYRRDLERQGLVGFFYTDEVLPLYKEVTIPMEEAGLALDLPKLEQAQQDLIVVLNCLEKEIQEEVQPLLHSVFTPWFLNKDYPLQTPTGKQPAWAKVHATQLDAWTAQNAGYMFNLQSKHHLKKVFFDTLKETPLSRTPTGQPQVDEEFLDSVAPKYAWCSKLVEYNKLQKIKSTYIDRFLEEQENGVFYPSYKQHGTVSGRLSGDFQQLPRPLEASQAPEAVVHFTNLIREFFIARPGCLLLSADYEQLEPSIFSHTSSDPALQRIFNEGLDFYSTIAINSERIHGASAEKTAPNYLGTKDKKARQKAKAYALGIAYGMTGYKLKFEIGVTEEEADKLVNDYLTAFPQLKEWMDASRVEVKRTGTIRTQSGRVRHMPEAADIFKRYGPVIDDDLELWKRYNNVPSVYAKAKADRKTYKNLLNNAINFQVQGLAASVMNRAGIAIVRRCKAEGLPFPFVGQIHDEWVAETEEQNAAQIGTLIQEEMQRIKLSVPLRTTPQFGTNYRQCK